MKKSLAVILVLLLVTALTFSFVGCGSNTGNELGSSETPGSDPNPNPNPELLNFEGIEFENSTVTYDGKEHKIEITGDVPTGTSVTYTNNKGTNAGTYNATCKLECEGYNTLTVSAVLKIEKADITGITFNGGSFEYDAEAHSIIIEGNVPYGVSVSYTYNGTVADSAIETGKYTVVATLTGVNYNPLTLTATMTIRSTEELLNVMSFNGAVYFQNNLDGNRLYKYEDGVLSKVNNDIAESFFIYDEELYYYSTSIFSKVIKKIDKQGNVSIVRSVSAESIACDGEYIYYAVNKLIDTKDENGIYKYKLDGSEEEPTRICNDKAAYLTVAGNYLVYSNLSDGKRLYQVSLVSRYKMLVFDKKVEYIIEDNGIVYFDAHDAVSSAIYKYNVGAATITKMSMDSGKYLVKAGNDIYYIGDDLITSTIFGDGIYKISVLAEGNLPGTKVLSADDDGFSSLATDGERLYFYKLSDKHLWCYDLESGELFDVMEGFVPEPEDIRPVGDTVIAEYNGEIYYTNPLDGVLNGSCLYKYNPETNQHFKVISDDVAGVWFNDGKMYYSTCVLTNYALFCMDLSTGESVKINSDRCEDLIFEGDYIYYLKVNIVGSSNSIMRIATYNIGNPDVDPEVIYDDKNVAVTGINKVGNTFYFVVNPLIGKQKLYSFTIGDSKATDIGETAFEVVCDGDTLYFYDDNDNAIKCYKGGTVTNVVTNVEVNDLAIANGKLYFSSMSKTVGVYACDLATKQLSKISESVGEAITVVGDNVWFVATAVEYDADYPVHKGEGDCALYCYNGVTLSKK